MSIRFLLDTDTCVAWLRRNANVRRQIAVAGPQALSLSVVTLAELRYGAACSAHPATNHQAIDDFLSGVSLLGLEPHTARTFGEVKAVLRSQGQLLEDADLLIAATALAYHLTIVTNNERHFARIPNLRIENWMLP